MLDYWSEWAFRVLVVVGIALGGRVLWALRGTTAAQGKTIKAQTDRMASMEALLKTMDRVLASTDERSMLARLKAHKEFVELERDALIKNAIARLEEVQAWEFRALGEALMSFSANVLPYVPKHRRTEFIEPLRLPGGMAQIKEVVHELAASAPDLAGPGAARYFQDTGSIHVPEEGKYVLTLPDGTTITYPDDVDDQFDGPGLLMRVYGVPRNRAEAVLAQIDLSKPGSSGSFYLTFYEQHFFRTKEDDRVVSQPPSGNPEDDRR